MGYRSEVIIIIHKQLIPEWLQMLCQNEAARELVFSDRDESETDFNNEGHLMYRWENIKWYDTYDCVSSIENWLNSQDEEFVRFVRCGEEGDDTEEIGWLASSQVYPVVYNRLEY